MASILALDSGNNLSGGVFATVCSTLGHTVTYLTSANAFGSADISDYDFIVRGEDSVTLTSRAFVAADPIQLNKLREWVNNGGIFINIEAYDTPDEGSSWFLCGGVTKTTFGSQSALNIVSPNTIFSSFVAADCDLGTGGDLYEWARYTTTGGLSTALTDTTNGSSVMLYGAQGNGRTIYSAVGTNSAPYIGAPWTHWFTDVLNWASNGAPIGGGTSGTESGTPGTAGSDESGFFCPAEGSIVESSGHSAFGPAIAFDMDEGKAFRWTNLPFTCGLTVPATCAASFELPDGKFFGTRNSRVANFGRNNIHTDGPWQNMVSADTTRLTVASGTSTSVTISGATLTTYGDRMSGMTCTLVKNYGTSSETRQERTIITNSATKIIVSWTLTGEGEAWDSNPASGDILFVGLIRPSIRWIENHGGREIYPSRLRADYVQDAEVTASQVAVQVDVYKASSGRRSLRPSDYTTAAATKITSLAEIDIDPQGFNLPPADGQKATAVEMTWDAPPEGRLTFRQFEADITQ